MITLRPMTAADMPALAAPFYQTAHTVCAGDYTPAEFEEKYLSPDYDPRAERYGKAD